MDHRMGSSFYLKMPFLVLMSFSMSNVITGETGIYGEKVLDFCTVENFELYEGDSFDSIIHIINEHLPPDCYLDDDFPEPVNIIGTEYTDEVYPGNVIAIPLAE